MFFAKIFIGVRKIMGSAGKNLLADLPSARQFLNWLKRERGRTDRTGDRLSMIAFTPRCPEERSAGLLRLVAILKKRLRSTDEVGWLDDDRIGVMLPGTSVVGAWKLADDICLEFDGDVAPPICTVYAYSGGLSGEEVPEGANADEEAGSERAVVALEALFVRPLPIWKHCLDVIGAVAGLAILSPLLAGIALAVKLTSRGPVLFRQMRSGRGGKPFVIYKFRTMAADAEARKDDLRHRNEQDGPAFKIRNDPRVTVLGRYLRKTSLDELPQLWNILVGDMSLVGPRPLPCAESRACVGWQRQRLDVTPGLTCIWQVRGRSQVSFADWVRMDMQYINSPSVWQDLKLLFLTVPAVLLRRGAH